MSARGRDGLAKQIKRLRQTFPAPAPWSPAAADGPAPAQPQSLEARLADLEHLVEGLQDSVYRQTQRLDKRVEDLEARIDPATLAAALSKDARERGL
jgi:hypothetical protein